MKTTTRLLTFIGGLFRSVITILFLFATMFAGFVDKKLLAGFLDIIGFSTISLGFVKPIAIIILVGGFFLNFKVTRNIFKSGKTGEKFLSNIFFAGFFIMIDLLILLFIRERLIYLPLALNGLIILASVIGIYAKSRGAYLNKEVLKEKTEIKKAENTKTEPKKTNKEKVDISKAPKLRKIEASEEKNTLACDKNEAKVYPLNFASEKKEDKAKLDDLTKESNLDKDEKIEKEDKLLITSHDDRVTLPINSQEENSSSDNIIEERMND